MAVGPQAGETRSLNWWRKKKKTLQGKLLFTTLKRRVRVPFLSRASLHNSQQRRPLQLLEIPHKDKVDPCVKEDFFSSVFQFCRCSVFGQSNSWKSGKVCVCEPEIHHNGGESGRRGNTRILPAPGSPDQGFVMPSSAAGGKGHRRGISPQTRKRDSGRFYF